MVQKLRDDQKLAMRMIAPILPASEVADMFGVSEGYVSHFKCNRVSIHYTPDPPIDDEIKNKKLEKLKEKREKERKKEMAEKKKRKILEEQKALRAKKRKAQ